MSDDCAVARAQDFHGFASREFASTAELAKATGHPVARWPLVIVKELIDNAIDAAEGANVAPVVDVAVKGAAPSRRRRGPGMPPELVANLVDYSKRTSSRAAYVSPTRGAQGNAMQTLIAMPFALDGSSGETLIESCGVRHASFLRSIGSGEFRWSTTRPKHLR